MAYGTPADPVGGTVITVAYAVANILDPIRWLRLLTGNADPPGSNYVVVSTSMSGTTWAKITADVIADGAVTPAKLDRLYIERTGGAFIQNLTAQTDSRGLVLSSGGFLRDTASPERTILNAAGSRFDVFNEAADTQMLLLTTSALQHMGQQVSYDGHTHAAYLQKAGDSMSGALTFVGDLIGITLSSGGRLRDQASPERTLLTAAGGRFSVFDEGGSNEILNAALADSAPTFKGTALSLGTHTHSYLPLAGGTVAGDITFSDDLEGIVLSSGGRLRDQASPGRTILNAAEGRLSVFDEGGSDVMLNLVASSNTAEVHGQAIVHAGNIGSQSVDHATTAGTAAAIDDGAVSTADKLAANVVTTSKILNANVTDAKLAVGAAASNVGNGGVSAAMLAAGAALTNLGFTPARMTASTYAGNSAGTPRQIATGFACKLVFIYDTTNNLAFILSNATEGIQMSYGGGTLAVSDVTLHATNGFVLGPTSFANTTGVTYGYVAMG